MTAIRVLMSGLIDYAGLFPPAKLDMQAAVQNYAAYRSGHEAWALGNFIVPAGRLAEFEVTPKPPIPWSLSVLLSGGAAAEIAADVRKMEELLSRNSGATVHAIECKARDAGAVEAVLALLPEDVPAYFELPLGEGSKDCIAVLAARGARAKIRTGGVTAAAFPDTNQVLDFIECCAFLNVPFKATAGLHHPLRSRRPLTYEENSASGVMHGFINVFLAAALAYLGADRAEILTLLEEQSASAFVLEDDGVRGHGHRITVEQLSEVRQRFAISFGSCSFTEPLHDLKALGWL